MLRAANSIADSKHADQPAAKSCSGLVPVPGLPGRDSLTSRRPSELRDMPARPPVVWALAVYSTFSSRFIIVLLHEEPRRVNDARSSVAIGGAAMTRHRDAPRLALRHCAAVPNRGTRQADRR